MIREVLAHFPWLNLLVIGQMIFLSLFAGALAWVFRPGSKKFYQSLAMLPIEEEKRSYEQ